MSDAFVTADLKEPLIIAGLVLAAAGAILWFGAFTLGAQDRVLMQRFATALSLLSPVCLAWPLLMTVGAVAWWVLLGFFVALLLLVALSNYLLPGALLRLRVIFPRELKRGQDDAEGRDQKWPQSDADQKPDRIYISGEHLLKLELGFHRKHAFCFAIGAAVGLIASRSLKQRH